MSKSVDKYKKCEFENWNIWNNRYHSNFETNPNQTSRKIQIIRIEVLILSKTILEDSTTEKWGIWSQWKKRKCVASAPPAVSTCRGRAIRWWCGRTTASPSPSPAQATPRAWLQPSPTARFYKNINWLRIPFNQLGYDQSRCCCWAPHWGADGGVGEDILTSKCFSSYQESKIALVLF